MAGIFGAWNQPSFGYDPSRNPTQYVPPLTAQQKTGLLTQAQAQTHGPTFSLGGMQIPRAKPFDTTGMIKDFIQGTDTYQAWSKAEDLRTGVTQPAQPPARLPVGMPYETGFQTGTNQSLIQNSDPFSPNPAAMQQMSPFVQDFAAPSSADPVNLSFNNTASATPAVPAMDISTTVEPKVGDLTVNNLSVSAVEPKAGGAGAVGEGGGGGSEQSWMKKTTDFLGSDAFANTLEFGKGLGNIWMGLQGLNLAEDQFDFTKSSYAQQYADQKALIDEQRQSRKKTLESWSK